MLLMINIFLPLKSLPHCFLPHFLIWNSIWLQPLPEHTALYNAFSFIILFSSVWNAHFFCISYTSVRIQLKNNDNNKMFIV